MTETRTTCPYCGVGCGLKVARAADGGGVVVQGDADHPANFGRLCSKGSALADTLGLDDRLLYPELGGRRVHWYRALDAVAEGFKSIIARHGRARNRRTGQYAGCAYGFYLCRHRPGPAFLAGAAHGVEADQAPAAVSAPGLSMGELMAVARLREARAAGDGFFVPDLPAFDPACRPY